MKRTLSLPAAAIGAVVLGVAGFGAGFAVRALNDDGAEPASSGQQPAIAPNTQAGFAPAPGFNGAPGRDIKVSNDGGESAQNSAGYGTSDMSIMPSCMADLPAAITSAGVDLAQAGFVVRPLGGGFVPVSFSVRSIGECDYSSGAEVAGPGKIVVDTTWRHVDTGIQVNISQQLEDGRLANVLRGSMASFTDGGYSYQVYANPYIYYGMDGGTPPEVSAREPASILPEGQDPRVTEVLLAAVRDLAPGFDEQCFAREVQGDWSGLAGFGLGDPRPAVPGGLDLQNMSFVYTNPAAVDCGGAELTADRGIQFSANWYQVDKSGSYLSVYAGGMGDYGYPGSNVGQIGESSATWQSNNISFSIYGSNNDGTGLGIDTIRAIAKALDPSFSEACFMTEETFGGGDLARFGLNTPVVPDGYRQGQERGVAYVIDAGCETPEGYTADAMSYWTQYQDDNGNSLYITLDRSPYGRNEPGMGYVSPGSVYFVTADGVMVSISGYNERGGEGTSLDTLKAIGSSIDPSVDYDALSSGGAMDGSKPMPVPAATGGDTGETGR